MHLGIKTKIRSISRFIFGTKIDQRYWYYKYKRGKSNLFKEFYAEDRLYLLEEIRTDEFNTVLEVGSKEGRNLRMIAKSFPDAKLIGVDISPEAVLIGNDLFKKEGLNNVTLFEGKAERLDFDDQCFDLVFVFAVLIYIDPKKINKVLSEMVRVASRRVLILEWHDPELSKGKFTNHWIYNYRKLFQSLRDQIQSLEITKIPEDEFEDINWKKYGYFIDVRIKG